MPNIRIKYFFHNHLVQSFVKRLKVPRNSRQPLAATLLKRGNRLKEVIWKNELKVALKGNWLKKLFRKNKSKIVLKQSSLCPLLRSYHKVTGVKLAKELLQTQ